MSIICKSRELILRNILNDSMNKQTGSVSVIQIEKLNLEKIL